MKKNLYYSAFFERASFIKTIIYITMFTYSHYFRIPIEVLIRKNMGERYFSAFISFMLGVGLFIFPLTTAPYEMKDWSLFLNMFFTWYAYLAFYLYCISKRWAEVRHLPSVYDFARCSTSTGQIHPFFKRIQIPGFTGLRNIETYYEPGVFFIVGFLLFLMSQPLGIVLMACAIVYSIGYMAAYWMGDNYVMDIIDKMLMNEDMEADFVDGADDKESDNGTRFYFKKPTSKEHREFVKDQIIVDVDKTDPDAGMATAS